MPAFSARRFSLIHLVLIAIVTLGATAWITRTIDARRARAAEDHDNPELAALKAKYGPKKNSYGPEEWIARDYFGDRRNGFFVDIGANHYKITSNTYYLDHDLGWSGIAVDALKEFQADYLKYRPRTHFFAAFISDRSNERAKMYVLGRNTQVSSSDKAFTEEQGKNAQELDVLTLSMNDLLDGQKVPHIDYLSIDIELSEPKALAGFDIDRFRPQLACIESHPQVRQQILDYFAAHHYAVVGKYLRADVNNLYFTPAS